MWVSKGAVLLPATARLDELSDEGSAGTAGVLKLACVLFVGSEGPGRGVMRESSSSSESGRERFDMSEAVEWETGEDRRGDMEFEKCRGALQLRALMIAPSVNAGSQDAWSLTDRHERDER